MEERTMTTTPLRRWFRSSAPVENFFELMNEQREELRYLALEQLEKRRALEDALASQDRTEAHRRRIALYKRQYGDLLALEEKHGAVLRQSPQRALHGLVLEERELLFRLWSKEESVLDLLADVPADELRSK